MMVEPIIVLSQIQELHIILLEIHAESVDLRKFLSGLLSLKSFLLYRKISRFILSTREGNES